MRAELLAKVHGQEHVVHACAELDQGVTDLRQTLPVADQLGRVRGQDLLQPAERVVDLAKRHPGILVPTAG